MPDEGVERDTVKRQPDETEDELYEMADLYPRDTGLPMTIWVSPKGGARHDVRIKVCTTHADRMGILNNAVVGVRPQPQLLEGKRAPQDCERVAKWIGLNANILSGYWEGTYLGG